MTRSSLLVAAVVAHMAGGTLYAQDLGGETQMSCAAILCLASSQRPPECNPPIAYYFAITRWRFWETLQARLDFLNLCPVAGAPGMASMKSALVYGAGRCDAATLNVELFVEGQRNAPGYVMNAMPDYCSAYFGHQYVRLDMPRYVGTPQRGGYWAEARDFDVALAAYTAKWIEIDRLAQESQGGRGGGRSSSD